MGSGLFQPMHLLIILVVVILIFGPGRLGNIGKDLGKSIKDFKKAMSEEDVTHKDTAPPAQAPKTEQIPPAAPQAPQAPAQTAAQAPADKDHTHG
ncbi:MAG: twin-arginine translocase TatA/TatE family subunit [Desulfovibrionaceae bacterium]|nr:twin-arginine translocase TatA/TatE family subunit [Desulfovibrionaceae bacterium]MBF0513578.1 twin-arginine translocase TatA/TatE family subunit [Desulfovibrionaceae bacterium]